MATKNKATETEVGVRDFLNKFVDRELKEADSYQLVELMTKWSGCRRDCNGSKISRLTIMPLSENLTLCYASLLASSASSVTSW